MIQLNLLPDVKTKYIKAERAKRTVVLVAVIISGVSVGIVLLLASVAYGAQKIQLNSLNSDITTNSQTLKKVDNLDKILTIQNQLNALPALHDGKPVVTRLFTFLPQITPTDVKISDYKVNFVDNTMLFTGSAKDLGAVNKFVDTLKFTKFTVDEQTDQKNAFSAVVLSSFARSDKEASYTINLKFDEALFSSKYKTVTLIVPQITSTRSTTESPGALFKEQAPSPTGGTN